MYLVHFTWFSALIALVSTLTMNIGSIKDFIMGAFGMFIVVALPLLSVALVLDLFRIRKYFQLSKKLNISYFAFLSLNKLQQENLVNNIRKD